ncbi:MAG TPA: hypothetical protein VEW69_07255 [Alphaproteobacteria bacterium]|nr:hypothetical protein [Alphaproteobacteria bacterium]
MKNELAADEADKSHWSYRLHREDDKNNYDRLVIESKDGELARTILWFGQPLTPDLVAKDEERMHKLVVDPADRAHRAKRKKDDEDKAKQLLQAIPDAFLFSYDSTDDGGLVRLNFSPNPRYYPPTREMQVFRAMAGHIWIDRAAKRLAAIDGSLTADVKFGWGLLGHLDKGGSFKAVHKNVGDDHWETVSLDINMTGRAIIFKTIDVKQKERMTDFRRVRDDISIDQAYALLQKEPSTWTAKDAAPASKPCCNSAPAKLPANSAVKDQKK